MANASPSQRLADFLKSRGWSQREAGEAFGCTQVMVSHILSRRSVPGRDIAVRIEETTRWWKGGCIRIADWPSKKKKVAGAAKATGTDGA